MCKYRKKPVEIEAIQFTRGNVDKIIKFCEGNIEIVIPRCLEGEMTGNIKTLEGIMVVSENDYVIKGVAGEFYPCKPDIFNKTYEKVGRVIWEK